VRQTGRSSARPSRPSNRRGRRHDHDRLSPEPAHCTCRLRIVIYLPHSAISRYAKIWLGKGIGGVIVLLGGMPRSGSTFSFNVVREVLRARGTIHQEARGDVPGAVHRSNGARHVLVKAHELDEPSMELAQAGAMRIIFTVRRVEDAIASWINTFEAIPEATLIEIMRRWLHMFAELRHQALVVSYEQIDRRPWLAAWRIARRVCPDIGPMEVRRIARRLDKAAVKRQTDCMQLGSGKHDLGWTYYDTETFLHRRHISDVRSRSAEERLPEKHLARIRDSLASDIAAAGLEPAAGIGRRHRAPAAGSYRATVDDSLAVPSAVK
jgi:hypothetical protein